MHHHNKSRIKVYRFGGFSLIGPLIDSIDSKSKMCVIFINIDHELDLSLHINNID